MSTRELTPLATELLKLMKKSSKGGFEIIPEEIRTEMDYIPDVGIVFENGVEVLEHLGIDVEKLEEVSLTEIANAVMSLGIIYGAMFFIAQNIERISPLSVKQNNS